jgi:hypothetical protein
MSSFEKKTLESGEPNPKYIDLCDEDPAVAGQKFVCMSFVSPEKILKKREMYIFDEFVKQWDFTKSMEKFNEFLQFMCYKYNLKPDDVMKNYDDFKSDEEAVLKQSSCEDEYKNFLDKYEDRLNADFNREHAFQTSVRGFQCKK